MLLFFSILFELFWFRVLIVKVAGIISVFLFLPVFWVCNRLFVRKISGLFLLGLVGFIAK